MNFRWTLNRMRAMGVREIRYRGIQYLEAHAQRAGYRLAAPMPAGDLRGKPWAAVPAEGFSVDFYRQAADEILSGRLRLFGNRVWKLGFPPDWNQDPSTGIHAPREFGRTLNYRDATTVGNIKYLWEPNRHLELVTLAQAWHLTREERYARGCWSLVDSWIEQCPYMLGANWTSSLELALRLVNWSCAWHLLGGESSLLFAGPDGRAAKERWLTAVRQHCHFIAGQLSLHSSANNHLLGELLGLFVGATTWPCWPESERWRTQSWRRFQQEAARQNAPDGTNKEQAIWYQHEVADMLLLGGLTARANDCDFGREFWQRLESLLEFLSSCMDYGGNLPMFGDSDDAVIVRFCPTPDFRPYHSLLASGAVLFQRGDFKHKAQTFDDKSRWLLGSAGATAFAALVPDASDRRLRRTFADGGYYILGSQLGTPNEVRLIADAGPLGYLAIAAHGHADALSLVLSIAGHPVLIDPGTYCYHTERRWRDYFRGTSAHNTLRVDRLDQSVSGGTFLWNRHAATRCLAFESAGESHRLVAEHNGYVRLADPVTHRREISYQSATRVVEVIDYLICAGSHHVEIFWHFDDEWIVEIANDVAVAAHNRMRVALRWPHPMQARLVRGQDEPCLGWVSRRFDHKVPTTTLVVAGSVGPNWRGRSTIEITVPTGPQTP